MIFLLKIDLDSTILQNHISCNTGYLKSPFSVSPPSQIIRNFFQFSEVKIVAKAFINLGLESRNSVGILGFNSPEWFFADLAAIFCNSISTGIYATNSPEMCQYMANHCHANILVVEDEHQLKKILAVKSHLTHLKAIVQYTGTPQEEGVLSWQQLLDLGKKQTDEELEQRLKKVAINQCCHLVYTSGK